MARCDQGYLCEVCGDEVDGVAESDLYLRFVIGEVKAGQLLGTPERHLRCNPVLAQFIDDPAFEPVTVEGDFDRRLYSASDNAKRVMLVTRGWKRLQELAALESPIPLSDYPLRADEAAKP